MEGYKTLFTCRSGISLMNMGVRFSAWDEAMQGNDPVDEWTYKLFVPEADIQFIECGSYDVINTENVIVDMEGEK